MDPLDEDEDEDDDGNDDEAATLLSFVSCSSRQSVQSDNINL